MMGLMAWTGIYRCKVPDKFEWALNSVGGSRVVLANREWSGRL